MKKQYYTNFDIVELENNEVFMRLGSKWYNMSTPFESHARESIPAPVARFVGTLHNKGTEIVVALNVIKDFTGTNY